TMAHTETKISSLDLNHRYAVIAHDLFMVTVAWALATMMPYELSSWTAGLPGFLISLPFVVIAQGVLLWWTGVYRGVWRSSSIPDLWNILRAVAAGVLAISLLLFLVNRMEGIPRTTLLIYPICLVFLLGASRLIYRVWVSNSPSLFMFRNKKRKRVLILGAGVAGELLARDMLQDSDYYPLGFLDDKKELQGALIRGIPVLGEIADLNDVVHRTDVDHIVISMPSASPAQLHRVIALSELSGIPFRILGRSQGLATAEPSVKGLREVVIDDLLGREPIALDWERISNGIRKKTVLITGAGGSIGSELCRQIARLGASALVLYERSEFGLYTIEMEMRRRFPNLTLHACLGDICDVPAVDHLLSTYRPDIIFHAAAYKHVPMLQEQARETLRNNVLGTKILALAAEKHGCPTFVMISTDKAVNPTSIMGISKHIAELFCLNLNKRAQTRFITVRFGNVLGSTGSVVPLFQEQIATGGPVTVTHPEITRFFMTIPEACQLIMQAAVMGQGGEIYVLDMGKPISITYLAEEMIRLAGKIPGKDIKIVYTGLRPGEKLFEELFHAQENLSGTEHEKILLAHPREVDWKTLNETLDELERACQVYNEEWVHAVIKKLLPQLDESVGAVSQKVVSLNRLKH
ncbi:MAG TPA: nucleoside-diphosphate sugar epimerase/dehydratase, partial [Gammaproteobacteria bacterium]|nr:nucleoside-diphosphate sugar epimerase/dehydratase [Gammaproteobacteria bacterium]